MLQHHTDAWHIPKDILLLSSEQGQAGHPLRDSTTSGAWKYPMRTHTPHQQLSETNTFLSGILFGFFFKKFLAVLIRGWGRGEP